MAACLITISGTSGEVKINYKISSNSKSLITGIGTVYIEDTATNVTYTTLTGDAVASSLCLTISSLPITQFKINWKGIDSPGYLFDRVTIASNNYTISAPFPFTGISLVNAVNGLNVEEVKIVKMKETVSMINGKQVTEYSYIVNVISNIVPVFRIKNADNTGNIYINGNSTLGSLTGYSDVPVCYPSV